ncbi:hypothetical protein [Roseivirga misakiensis]|uniref:hypothetical protein n=1 Tax=Roseivirga misakiensis TaxID=1563681 RepID=UPI00159F2FE4|nr:hypothetical protein [Roseivirga misakiensis]
MNTPDSLLEITISRSNSMSTKTIESSTASILFYLTNLFDDLLGRVSLGVTFQSHKP